MIKLKCHLFPYNFSNGSVNETLPFSELWLPFFVCIFQLFSLSVYIIFCLFVEDRLYIFSIVYFIPPLHASSHDLLVAVIQSMIIDLYMDAW